MEASRSRRHSADATGRRGTLLHHDPSVPTATEGSIMPHLDRSCQQQLATHAGLSSGSSAAARRRRSGGRRRSSKGGEEGSDFCYSPYQPMIIKPTFSSLSPRPRRASAPISPASMVLHKSLGGDTRRNTVGPTLEQCLVLPPGVALKVDGLLSQQPLLSKLGAEDGGRDGGGGDGLDQVASKEGVGGSLQAGRGEGGLHAGDDRAIISTYTFEPASLQAAATREGAVEHAAPAAGELDPVGDAVTVVSSGPREARDGTTEEGCATTPAEETLDPEGVCSSAGASDSRQGIDDREMTGASAATTVTMAGEDETAEGSVVAGEEADAHGSLGEEDELASDVVPDRKAFDDAVVVDLREGTGDGSGGFGGVGIDPHSAASPLAVVDVGQPEVALVAADAAADKSLTEGHHEEGGVLTTGAGAEATATVAEDDEPAGGSMVAGEEPNAQGTLGGEGKWASYVVADRKASDDAVIIDSQGETGGGSGGLGSVGIDPHRAASLVAVVDSRQAEAALVIADAAEKSLTEGHHGEGGVLPHAVESETFGLNGTAADSCETSETVHSSPILEAGESLNDGQSGAAMGGGVSATARGSEDDYDNDEHVSEEDMAEGTGAASVEHKDSVTAREESGEDKAGYTQEEDNNSRGSEDDCDNDRHVSEDDMAEGTGAAPVERKDSVTVREESGEDKAGYTQEEDNRRGSEDDCDNDGHVSEDDMTEGTGAASVERKDSVTAREESGADKAGHIQEGENSTCHDRGDVALEVGNERARAPASEEEALGGVVTPVAAGASMVCNGSRIAAKAEEGEGVVESSEDVQEHEMGQVREIVGEGSASGVITGEATASLSSCPATNDQEKKEKQNPVAAETAVPLSSFALGAVAEPAQPPAQPPVEHHESGLADADDGALSPAIEAYPSHVTDSDVSDVAKDPSGRTSPEVAVQKEGGVPLDWEALAREVEAEWVMEGSDGESGGSLSTASSLGSPTPSLPPPPTTAGVPSPYDVAVAVLEASSADSLGEQEDVEVCSRTSRDEGEQSEFASGVLEAPPAAATQPSRQWEGDSGGGRGGGISCILEDSKEQGEGDSDCGSPVPAASEGEDQIPADKAQVPTHATTCNTWRQQQSSASTPSAGVQLPDERTYAIDPMEDDAARSVVSEEGPLPAPIRPPGVAEQVDGGRGNHQVPPAAPVPASTAESVPPVSGSHDGGVGVPLRPGQESARREVGGVGRVRAGGVRTGSCCVVM